MTATVDLAIELQARGYQAVPHLSARMIEHRHELASIIKRLDDGGVGQVFITGGDGRPQGDYTDALSLLEDMAIAGHPFLEVGITGYPEGHPFIPRTVFANRCSTSRRRHIYRDPDVLRPRSHREWIKAIRADGVKLPVKVGVPGVVDPARLLSIAARIGWVTR